MKAVFSWEVVPMTSKPKNKLPPDYLTEEKWDVEKLMKEKLMPGNAHPPLTATALSRRPLHKVPPTAAALMASNLGPAHCAFCEQSSSCAIVTDVSARKEALRKAGRC